MSTCENVYEIGHLESAVRKAGHDKENFGIDAEFQHAGTRPDVRIISFLHAD